MEIKGLDRLVRRLERAPDNIIKVVDEELTEGAKAIEERAVLLAPNYRGGLVGNIFADTTAFLRKRIVAGSFYAAYVEFGTKRKFKPNGRGNIAKQFQGKSGKGGTIDQFREDLAEWIRLKGILTGGKAGRKRKDDKYALAAYWMSIRILQNGISPANNGTGYFFRSYDELIRGIIQKVVKRVKSEIK